ncbi:MAG: acyltransferase family protein, partial [Roseovarius sp.]
NFYFTFSRLWELLAGSICAVILYARPQLRNNAAALAGLLLIMWSVFNYTAATPFPSVYALVPIIGTALVILYADTGTWAARALSAAPMVWIGLISYSAYLWHQPLFAFARIRSIAEPSLWVMSALSLVTLGLAWLTMRFVETPFRRRRILPGRRALLSVSAISIVAISALGFTGVATAGFPARLGPSAPGFLSDMRAQLLADRPATPCIDGGAGSDEALCTVFGGPSRDAPQIALLGDSHGQALLPGFASLSQVHGVDVQVAARGACPPLLGVYLARGGDYARDCHDFVRRSAEEVVQDGIQTVYLVARWSLYTTGEYADARSTFALVETPGAQQVNRAARLANFEAALDRTLAYYVAAGVRVVLVGQVPLQTVMAQTMIEQAMLMRLDSPQAAQKFEGSFVQRDMAEALVQASDEIIGRVAARYGAQVLTLAGSFQQGNAFAWIRDGASLYRDTNHVSVAGALSLAPLLSRSYFAP